MNTLTILKNNKKTLDEYFRQRGVCKKLANSLQSEDDFDSEKEEYKNKLNCIPQG